MLTLMSTLVERTGEPWSMAWTSSTGEKDMTLDCWLESLGKREDRAGWMDGSAAANLGNRQMAALLIPAFAFVHVLYASTY